MKLRIYLILFLALTLACKKEKETQATLNGIWNSIGSGWVLHIQDSSHYSIYDHTDISCIKTREASLSEIESSLRFSNDTLYLKKGVMTYQFVKAENLAKSCSNQKSTDKNDDVLYNFEVFAQTVKDHYAFMELNKLNWGDLYARQKEKLLKDPSSVNLYKILVETLVSLNDNHAYLEADESVYQLLEAETDSNEPSVTENQLPEFGDFQVADLVAKHHLDKDLTKDSWLLKWGTMKDSIGYIQIKAMWLFADLDIPQELIDEKGFVDAYVDTFHKMNESQYIEKEVLALRQLMDRIMHDLDHTKAMVLDIRFNGGGQDAVSFEILKRFNDQRRKSCSTKLKWKSDYTPVQALYMEATENAYTKPVYVLTSKQTGSAAEAFSLNAMALPHVTRIGTSTQGALSTALEKKLPNGWFFSISNEVYMDTKEKSYENIGIPVDIQLNYPDDRQRFFRSVVANLKSDKEQILQSIHQAKLRQQ